MYTSTLGLPSFKSAKHNLTEHQVKSGVTEQEEEAFQVGYVTETPTVFSMLTQQQQFIIAVPRPLFESFITPMMQVDRSQSSFVKLLVSSPLLKMHRVHKPDAFQLLRT